MLKQRIDYPVPVDAYSADGRPLWLWAPTPVVVAAERLLPRRSRVVDLGAGQGSNGIYLAMQGHEVYSVETNRQATANGRRISRSLGEAAMTHMFVEADMRGVDLESEFGPLDAILAVRSLQQLTKGEAKDMVGAMQAATKPGGINAALAYVASPEQQQLMAHRALFEPNQLDDIYQTAGWNVLENEVDLRELAYQSGAPTCQSTVSLIATKPTA